MGEMPDLLLEEIFHAEHLRDEYTHGYISDEEAYELGFLYPMGTEEEGMQDYWDRCNIKPAEDLDGAVRSLTLLIDSFRGE
jgi:hypothetical protein